MIRHAVADKLRARGAIGFAADAVETVAVSCFWGALIGTGIIAVTVVGLPLVAADKAIGWLAGEAPRSCDAGCAAHREDCEDAA